MQADMLEEPLKDWTKYRISVKGRACEAWYRGGAFITEFYELVNEDEIDSYVKIGELRP